MNPTCHKVGAEFALAGKAIFTVVSTKTNTRFTFQVKRGEFNPDKPYPAPPWFVRVLTGADNASDSSYSFLGTLFPDGEYRHGRKSRISPNAASAVAAAWLMPRLFHKHSTLSQVEIFHEGRCGRCGRRLTVPTSIESGIGPECAKLSQ